MVANSMGRSTSFWLCLSLPMLSFAGCGGETFSLPPETFDPVATEETTLSLDSTSACGEDIDCKLGYSCDQETCVYECGNPEGAHTESPTCEDGYTCSDRGICELAALQTGQVVRSISAAGEYFSGLRLEAAPQVTVYQPSTPTTGAAGSDADTWVFELTFSVPSGGSQMLSPPARGMHYRIERNDDPTRNNYLRFTPLTETTENGVTTAKVTIPIPTGSAAPSKDLPTDVSIRLVTPVRNFQLFIDATPPASAVYSGDVRLDLFGTVGFPLEFQIVTHPGRSTLEDATEAFFVLEVDDANLFRPHEAPWEVDETAARPDLDDPKILVAAPITYSAPLGAWVATFTNAFRLPSTFGVAATIDGQVERALRFEFNIDDDGYVEGVIRDSWTGIYDARSAGNIVEPATVSLQGSLLAQPVRRSLARPALDTNLAMWPARTAASPAQLPAPSLSVCTDAVFDVPTLTPESSTLTYACPKSSDPGDTTIQSVVAFADAAPQDQAACALAVAEQALASGGTVATVLSYISDASAQADSFQTFLDRCATFEDGTCEPSAEVLCARQLLAYAYALEPDASDYSEPMVDAYSRVTREATLGRQLAALAKDMEFRESWLTEANFPDFVSGNLASWIGEQLDAWRATVLDAQIGVIATQTDPAGLTVLARAISGDAASRRSALLLDVTTAWRSSMTSLNTAARRWNDSLRIDSEREVKASEVKRLTLQLYIYSALLADMNSINGNQAYNAAFGAGFSRLWTTANKLDTSFDRLIYLRDAEPLLIKSLDPETNDSSALGERRTRANAAIDAAQAATTAFLAELRAEALNNADARGNIVREIDTVYNDMISLCGIPVGCSIKNVKDGATGCSVRTEPGGCGLKIARATGNITGVQVREGDANVSDAAKALLELADAQESVSIAAEEVNAHIAGMSIAAEGVAAFQAAIAAWETKRKDNLSEITALADAVQDSADSSLATFSELVAARAAGREASIQTAKAFVAGSDGIRRNNNALSMKRLRDQHAEQKLSLGFEFGATTAQNAAGAAVDAIPKVVGLAANDAHFFARGVIRTAGFLTSTAMRGRGLSADIATLDMEALRAQASLETDAQWESRAAAQEIVKLASQTDLDNLEDQLAVLEFETDPTPIRTLMTRLAEEAKADREFEEDLRELRRLQDEFDQRETGVRTLRLKSAQAQLKIHKRRVEYLDVVQRAQLQKDRLGLLQAQLENLDAVLGSAAIVFARANGLEATENDIARAKEALMDWLVAIEYLAVRPFIDERLLVLLATNPAQLAKISTRLDHLQNNCGDRENDFQAELSLKRDLLGLRTGIIDAQGTKVSSAERFRRLLNLGNIPVNKRIRHGSGDDDVGHLIDRGTDLMSATFELSLKKFANLSLVCNAKVAGVSFKLVGDVGDGLPTITLLTDGTAQLRSCQPNIETYVLTNTRGFSPFGAVMSVDPPARGVSPVAGIADFPSDNVTLAGSPLARSYTLMIDKNSASNQRIDWTELDDIMVRFSYSYQDLFPLEGDTCN